MCGFSGILKLNNENNLDVFEIASLMNERLRHRGPDDSGTKSFHINICFPGRLEPQSHSGQEFQ